MITYHVIFVIIFCSEAIYLHLFAAFVLINNNMTIGDWSYYQIYWVLIMEYTSLRVLITHI